VRQAELVDFFRGKRLEQALAAYSEGMVDQGWPVGEKVRLYDAAHRAYECDGTDDDGLAEFTIIGAAIMEGY